MYSFDESAIEWRAFLYANDELSAEDATRFEELLENDQSARDAVAHVVGLQEVTSESLGTKVPLVVRSVANASRAGWQSAVVGVALAGLLLALIPLTFSGSTSPRSERNRSSDVAGESIVDRAAFLVAAWTDGGDDVETEDERFDSEWCGPVTNEHAGYAVAGSGEFVVPSWMYAAVADDMGLEPGGIKEGPMEN